MAFAKRMLLACLALPTYHADMSDPSSHGGRKSRESRSLLVTVIGPILFKAALQRAGEVHTIADGPDRA
jgi:hypothetical protein